MQPIRLIAMDMDGTLLTRIDPKTACIPPENAAALQAALDKGVHLALASGRMPDDASYYAHDAGLPMHIISLNGGVTLDQPLGEPTSMHLLPEATSRRLLEILQGTDLEVAIFGAWEVVSLKEHPFSWAQRVLGTYFGREGARLTYHSGCAHVPEMLPKAAKFVVLANGYGEQLATVKAQIQAEFPDLELAASWWDNFELNPPKISKGSALTELAAHLHIPMEQVMAIGDSGNDVSMLAAAGIGVAMGNGNDDVKAAADVVTLSNTEHGVAAAIRALVLGENVPGVVRK